MNPRVGNYFGNNANKAFSNAFRFTYRCRWGLNETFNLAMPGMFICSSIAAYFRSDCSWGLKLCMEIHLNCTTYSPFRWQLRTRWLIIKTKYAKIRNKFSTMPRASLVAMNELLYLDGIYSNAGWVPVSGKFLVRRFKNNGDSKVCAAWWDLSFAGDRGLHWKS